MSDKIQGTKWENEDVRVPMDFEDFQQTGGEMEACKLRLIYAKMAKKQAADDCKEVESEYMAYALKMESRKIIKSRPTRTVFDWDKGIKKKLAVLDDGQIYEVCQEEITSCDRQMKIDTTFIDTPEHEDLFEEDSHD